MRNAQLKSGDAVYQRKTTLTTKESLHLCTVNPSLITITEDQSTEVDNAFPIGPHLDLAILLSRIIELHTLADLVPCANFEIERPTGNGCAICGVALRKRLDVANLLVGSVFLGLIRSENQSKPSCGVSLKSHKIGVQLSHTCRE
jgi:hypothetical protein